MTNKSKIKWTNIYKVIYSEEYFLERVITAWLTQVCLTLKVWVITKIKWK